MKLKEKHRTLYICVCLMCREEFDKGYKKVCYCVFITKGLLLYWRKWFFKKHTLGKWTFNFLYIWRLLFFFLIFFQKLEQYSVEKNCAKVTCLIPVKLYWKILFLVVGFFFYHDLYFVSKHRLSINYLYIINYYYKKACSSILFAN